MFLGNLSDAQYNLVEGVRNTELGYALKSINHYTNKEREEKDAFRIGRAFHCFLLEPEIFAKESIVLPADFDKRSKDRKAQWEEWERANRIIVKADEFEDFKKMKESLMNHPVIKNVLEKSSNEGVYTAEMSGVKTKCKIDIENSGYIFDLKTTTDASPEALESFITKWDTARQLSFYGDIYKANGKELKGVGIIAIEKTAPFNCSINTIDISTIDHGRDRYNKALNKIADFKAGRITYTGYSDTVGVLTAKQWYFHE